MSKNSRVKPECAEMLPECVRREPSREGPLRPCAPWRRSFVCPSEDAWKEHRDDSKVKPTYAEMVPECERWDICRTKAFEYARHGLIETFVMGRKRYVVIASLESLPARLRAMQGGQS